MPWPHRILAHEQGATVSCMELKGLAGQGLVFLVANPPHKFKRSEVPHATDDGLATFSHVPIASQ